MTKKTHYFEAVIFEGKERMKKGGERESDRNRSRNREGKAGKGIGEKQF